MSTPCSLLEPVFSEINPIPPGLPLSGDSGFALETVKLTSANSATSTGGHGDLMPTGRDQDPVAPSSDGSETELEPSDRFRGRAARYRMSTQIAKTGSDFLVLNDAGEHVLLIDGRLLADEDTISVEHLTRQVRYQSVAHLARKMDRLAITDAGGNEVGSVVRKQISPLRDRFVIELVSGQVLLVDGKVANHEFSLSGIDGPVAEVSRRWFRARNSYGVEIKPGQPDALLITAILAMDSMVFGVD